MDLFQAAKEEEHSKLTPRQRAIRAKKNTSPEVAKLLGKSAPKPFHAALRFVSFSFGRSARNVVMADEKGVRYFVRLSDFEACLQGNTPDGYFLLHLDVNENLVIDGHWLTEKKGSAYLTRPTPRPQETS